MSNVECDIPGATQRELLRGQGLYQREKEAWQSVLGVEINVKPLPEYVTPEVQRNLERIGFGLRYVPNLDLKSISDLRERGVKSYLTELQQKYPKWSPLEKLRDHKRADNTIPRNLEEYYWESVRDGNVAFPVLPGQWLAVETVEKPWSGKKYEKTPFAEKLGFRNDRFNVSWNDVHNAIEREKQQVLEEISLSGQPVDIRLLEAHEWNLLGNREGWGKSDEIEEWTNTEYRISDVSRRLFIGDAFCGGAGYVGYGAPDNSNDRRGFRAAVVLDSGQNEQK